MHDEATHRYTDVRVICRNRDERDDGEESYGSRYRGGGPRGRSFTGTLPRHARRRAGTAGGELARLARIAPSTASAHLAKLVDAGFLVVECCGRHRYFRLATPQVARSLEALALLAPPLTTRLLRESHAARTLCTARMCYDHLAGRLGVAIADGLVADGILEEGEDGYAVTSPGIQRLVTFGVDVPAIRGRQRRFAPYCLDWSERRHHVAGAIGAAIADQCFTRGWVTRIPAARAVRMTEAGRRGLREWFGIIIDNAQSGKGTASHPAH